MRGHFMLTQLDIRNIVLIDALTLNFARGLSVLTGETGAGKSILLDALGLLRGDRADGGLLRAGAAQGSVSATFMVPHDHAIHAILNDQGIEVDDTIILRRVMTADGKSRAFINDQSVTVTLLRQVGRMLIDLHGQFDTSDLMNPVSHLGFIDLFGNLRTQGAAVRIAWDDLKDARAKLAQAQNDVAQAARDEDYIRAELKDLDELDPEVGEEETLVTRKNMVAARAQIIEGLMQALECLENDKGAEAQIVQAARVIDRLRPKLGEAGAPWLASLDTALSQVREVGAGINATLFNATQGDVGIDTIEDRLYALRACARRHHCAVDELPGVRAKLAQQLQNIDGGAQRLDALQVAVTAAEATYMKAAGALSTLRRKAATKFDAGVVAELPPLKLDKAKFVTEMTPRDVVDYGQDGIDQIRFLVATNPGSAPGPLNKIVSGGELSRLMLAFKVVMAGAHNTHVTMIFDEVDSGIGGAVADAMAQRLARLSVATQVLVVTHAPQVAAHADHHFVVSKSVAGNTTRTQVVEIDMAARREEIARMLSGEKVTDEARAAAQKLMEVQAA